MELIVDASVAVRLALEAGGFPLLADPHHLWGPPLLWSEGSSVIHEMRWRREISTDLATLALDRLVEAPIEPVTAAGLLTEAWRVADEAGWAKTYDAEYVAAARLTERTLVTLDARLRKGAARFVDVRTPAEVL